MADARTTPAPLAKVDGLQLTDLLRAGIYRLFERTDHLNRINVFPVPDGDTGTNMSMTLAAVLAAIERQPSADAGKLLARAADAALDGARGNSGAILAQFLLGLGDGAAQRAELGMREFIDAVGTGAAYARDALQQPREGTILTVLRAFAEALRAESSAPDFASLFARAMLRTRAALEGTRGQLEELRAAGVVDAGALGFVEVLEGMLRFLQTGELSSARAPVHADAEHAGDGTMAGTAPVAADQDFRYCTECMVLAHDGGVIDLRALRETLGAAGSSLVVSGSTRKAKVHIHCDDPEPVFRLAGGFGVVQGQKADDMRMQQGAAHHRRTQRVVVVTDSGSDLPEDAAERLGIHMVAARIHFGGVSYLDKVSMTSAEFYDELARNPDHPKTSQPPPGDFRRIFEFLASHFESIVSVNLTARHSGTYNAAVLAAQRVSAEGRKVGVVDSLNASVGEALVTMAAAEAAAEGRSFDEVMAVATEARTRTFTFAMLERVDFAVRGGRVPAVVGRVARWLRLNVILRTFPDGRVKAGGGLIGDHRRIERFARYVARRAVGRRRTKLRIVVAQADRPEEGRRFQQLLLTALPPDLVERCDFTDMGAAIGVHGGPGTIIVAVQRR